MFPGQTDTIHPFGSVIGRDGRDGWVLPLLIDAVEAFGEDDDARARDVVLLQCLADDFFGFAVGVDVGLVGRNALE